MSQDPTPQQLQEAARRIEAQADALARSGRGAEASACYGAAAAFQSAAEKRR